MRTSFSWRHGLCAALALLAAQGCTLDEKIPPDAGNPNYVERDQNTVLHGYTYDAEAYLFSLKSCSSCGPPEQREDNKNLQRSMLVGANLQVVDAQTYQSVASLTAPTSATGIFLTKPFEQRQELVNLAVTGTPTLATVDGITALAIPPANYLPTVTLRPLRANYGECFQVESNQVADNGALESIARLLTQEGTPTTVADLTGPDRFGGVVLAAMYGPTDDPVLREPASDVTVNVNTGRVIYFDWAKPDANLPAAAKALQSTRGFYVKEGATKTAAIGLFAILIPKGESPAKVTMTIKDDTVSALKQRPWWRPATEFVVPSGFVGFAPVKTFPYQADGGTFLEFQTELPSWLCDPEWVGNR